MPEVKIDFCSSDHVSMSSGDNAYIFTFSVHHQHREKIKIYIDSALYITTKNEEILQDVWLKGLNIGSTGFMLGSGNFTKIGCVFHDTKVSKLLKGDKILLIASSDSFKNKYEFIFECNDHANGKFNLLSSYSIPANIDDTTQDTKHEVTSLVERLELLEEKFDISIEGIYATCEKMTWNSPQVYRISVNFDVKLTTTALNRSLFIRINAYNSKGQLLQTLATYINKEEFIGIFSHDFCLVLDQPPSKLRIFPTM